MRVIVHDDERFENRHESHVRSVNVFEMNDGRFFTVLRHQDGEVDAITGTRPPDIRPDH